MLTPAEREERLSLHSFLPLFPLLSWFINWILDHFFNNKKRIEKCSWTFLIGSRLAHLTSLLGPFISPLIFHCNFIGVLILFVCGCYPSDKISQVKNLEFEFTLTRYTSTEQHLDVSNPHTM